MNSLVLKALRPPQMTHARLSHGSRSRHRSGPRCAWIARSPLLLALHCTHSELRISLGPRLPAPRTGACRRARATSLVHVETRHTQNQAAAATL
eukprot:scaffold33268_cov69-Phaeocystis_antarctica.AAC.3